MDTWAITRSLVLVLAAATTPALAQSGTSTHDAPVTADVSTDPETFTAADYVDAMLAVYQQNERALYDTLVADPSPRMQVLAGNVYLSRDDATPTILRPKREAVVARAVEAAPDDAFVQWTAATTGSYAGSNCGPVSWPDAEVANLLRLEPDNAAAWQFGVALAHAKGDETGVDEALSRMAAARRADDHAVDELGAWTASFSAHPELIDFGMSPYKDMALTPAEKARLTALGRIQFNGSSATSELRAVCNPDGASDRTWQRLGWCADAARLFADKGSSLELREQGLTLLTFIGDHSDETVAAQREYAWLEANKAYPVRQFGNPDEVSATLADWNGASSEVAAIQHRLKRLGLPATPPAVWNPQSRSDEEDAAIAANQTRYLDYVNAVLSDMRASSKPEQRVFAAINETMFASMASENAESAPQPAAVAKTGSESITMLAQANAENIGVQWMIANAGGADIPEETRAVAIAYVQQAESDNAAAWALSLETPSSASSELVDTLLQRMAASTRYDNHALYGISTFVQAMHQRPLPPELPASLSALSSPGATSDLVTMSMAFNFSNAKLFFPRGVVEACSPAKNAAMPAERRDTCAAIGHLLVRNASTMIGVRLGEGILRRLGAFDAADRDRSRHVWWWQSMVSSEAVVGGNLKYADEYLASGNEIEAYRSEAERLGKLEPPANWKSPSEKTPKQNTSK